MDENQSNPFLLLVTDDYGTKHLLKPLLEHSYVIVEAASQDEVLEILSHRLINYIIIEKPVQNNLGIEICREIRKHKRYGYIPILLIIDENDGALAQKALLAGITNFLPKPLTHESVSCALLVAKHYSSTIQEMTTFSHKLKKIAEHDELTNLYNRYILFDQGKKEIAKAQRSNLPLSLLMIDIDRFKSVNDQYGHLIGDEILAKFAALISKTQRSYDLTVRFGGEEFVILLPNTSAEQSAIVAEKIRRNINEHTFIASNGAPIHLSVSIGVTSFNHENNTLEELLEEADEALYVAKLQGRNRVYLAPH